jgi:acetoin utilization deacetylase AcuC-like enzyme
MLRTGLVLDARYEAHTTPPGHPERPDRIVVLCQLVDQLRRDSILRIDPRPATEEELTYNHDVEHVRQVQSTAQRRYSQFDPDTSASQRSYEIACLAVGGCLELVDQIMAGEIDNGFAMVRPPGHHAERDRAMGFCLFNNVAVAAHHLRRRHGLQRILIMDWDVHHGNGTQHSFYDDPGVLYISTHQYPHYPGTGAADEVGVGAGRGATVNIPLPAGGGNEIYGEAFRTIVEPIARQFDPRFVLISAGFDCHRRDPLGGMEVDEQGIAAMTRSLLRIAREHCSGRCAAVLEGGYDLRALRDSAETLIVELGGLRMDEKPPTTYDRQGALEPIRAIQASFWNLPGATS